MHKFGIDLPKSVDERLNLDKNNGNKLSMVSNAK